MDGTQMAVGTQKAKTTATPPQGAPQVAAPITALASVPRAAAGDMPTVTFSDDGFAAVTPAILSADQPVAAAPAPRVMAQGPAAPTSGRIAPHHASDDVANSIALDPSLGRMRAAPVDSPSQRPATAAMPLAPSFARLTAADPDTVAQGDALPSAQSAAAIARTDATMRGAAVSQIATPAMTEIPTPRATTDRRQTASPDAIPGAPQSSAIFASPDMRSPDAAASDSTSRGQTSSKAAPSPVTRTGDLSAEAVGSTEPPVDVAAIRATPADQRMGSAGETDAPLDTARADDTDARRSLTAAFVAEGGSEPANRSLPAPTNIRGARMPIVDASAPDAPSPPFVPARAPIAGPEPFALVAGPRTADRQATQPLTGVLPGPAAPIMAIPIQPADPTGTPRLDDAAVPAIASDAEGQRMQGPSTRREGSVPAKHPAAPFATQLADQTGTPEAALRSVGSRPGLDDPAPTRGTTMQAIDPMVLDAGEPTAVAATALDAPLSGTSRSAAPTPDNAETRHARPAAHPATGQVAVSVARAVEDGVERISIKLQPPELGRIDVRLDLGTDGRVQAMILADRPATLEILQRDMRELERALAGVGLDASAGGLSFGLRQNGNGQGGAQAGHPGHDRRAAGDQTAADRPPTRLHRPPRASGDGRLDIQV